VLQQKRRVALLVAVLTILPLAIASAQIQYKSGQDVAPVFEGWIRNADQSIDFVFGYMNRNYEEQLDVPIGPNNNIQPGGPDRAQPTHFDTRRNQSIFRVRVGKDWDPKQKLVWTLTTNGRTDVAKAWLQPEWEIDSGFETAKHEKNEPPKIAGPSSQTIVWPTRTVALKVTATDDGVPKPPARRRAGAAQDRGAAATQDPDPDPDSPRPQSGLNLRWIQFRGPGKVTFEPASAKPAYGTPVSLETTATFSMPGTYVLWAIAKDGLAQTTYPVTVTVDPAR